MVKTKIKRAVSFVMATVLSLSAFMSIGTSTAFAASGEKTNVYMVDFPRDGDANYDGVWGHSNLTLKNGWHTGSSTHTNLKAIGSYSGNIAYCIEPGVSLSSGQSMNKYDENYLTISQQTELSPAMKSDSLSVVSCSTAIEERFQQAGGRRTKVRQTVLLTLMQHSFLSGKLS